MEIRVVKIGDKVYKKYMRGTQRGEFYYHKFNGNIGEGEIIKVGTKYVHAKFDNKRFGGPAVEKIPIQDLISHNKRARYFYSLEEFHNVEKRKLMEIEVDKKLGRSGIVELLDEDLEDIYSILQRYEKEEN